MWDSTCVRLVPVQVKADDGPGWTLMMTVEEAATLDIVVRLCRVAKLTEIEC